MKQAVVKTERTKMILSSISILATSMQLYKYDKNNNNNNNNPSSILVVPLVLFGGFAYNNTTTKTTTTKLSEPISMTIDSFDPTFLTDVNDGENDDFDFLQGPTHYDDDNYWMSQQQQEEMHARSEVGDYPTAANWKEDYYSKIETTAATTTTTTSCC